MPSFQVAIIPHSKMNFLSVILNFLNPNEEDQLFSEHTSQASPKVQAYSCKEEDLLIPCNLVPSSAKWRTCCAPG